MPTVYQTSNAPHVDVQPNDKAKAHVQLRPDGTLDTNFVWGFKGEAREKVISQLEEKAALRDELLSAAAEVESSNPALATQLREQASGIDKLFDAVKLYAKGSGVARNSATAVLKNFDGGACRDLLNIANHAGAMGGEDFNAMVMEPQGEVVHATTSSTGDAKLYGSYTKDEWKEMMTNDPNAAAKAMEGEDPMVIQMLMQDLQKEMQIQNQIFTFMSNYAKANHDTQKAILANLRV